MNKDLFETQAQQVFSKTKLNYVNLVINMSNDAATEVVEPKSPSGMALTMGMLTTKDNRQSKGQLVPESHSKTFSKNMSYVKMTTSEHQVKDSPKGRV